MEDNKVRLHITNLIRLSDVVLLIKSFYITEINYIARFLDQIKIDLIEKLCL